MYQSFVTTFFLRLPIWEQLALSNLCGHLFSYSFLRVIYSPSLEKSSHSWLWHCIHYLSIPLYTISCANSFRERGCTKRTYIFFYIWLPLEDQVGKKLLKCIISVEEESFFINSIIFFLPPSLPLNAFKGRVANFSLIFLRLVPA